MTMPPAITRLICAMLCVACCTGCVGTYDPAASSRYSLETRAQEAGRAGATRDGREGLRIFGRGGADQEQPAAVPDRFAEVRPGVAIPDTPAGKRLSWLIGVFNGGGGMRVLKAQFSERFLTRTSESEVRRAMTQWRRDEFADGPADVYELEDSALSRVSAVVRGRATGRYSRIEVSTDTFGRIGALSLSPLLEYRPGDLSEWMKVDARLAEMSGTVGLAAYEITGEGPRAVHRFKADQVLSIGGVSGLYIAGALAEQVAAGKATWDEPMQIVDELKSLMGGRMQLEPPETQFPLSQFLSLMLDSGDTTAFDHLLGRAERPNVESYMSRFNSAPGRNTPFLATMEYYKIKLGSDRTLPAKFGAADEVGRRVIISPEGPADKSVPSLTAAANWRLPFEIERIGWFASADDLSRVLADLHAASRGPGMRALVNALRMSDAVEPGSPVWRSAAFKSGSEPGVLAMVWLLERADGKWFTLVLAANDPKRPVSQTDLNAVASAAVKLLGEQGVRR